MALSRSQHAQKDGGARDRTCAQKGRHPFSAECPHLLPGSGKHIQFGICINGGIIYLEIGEDIMTAIIQRCQATILMTAIIERLPSNNSDVMPMSTSTQDIPSAQSATECNCFTRSGWLRGKRGPCCSSDTTLIHFSRMASNNVCSGTDAVQAKQAKRVREKRLVRAIQETQFVEDKTMSVLYMHYDCHQPLVPSNDNNQIYHLNIWLDPAYCTEIQQMCMPIIV